MRKKLMILTVLVNSVGMIFPAIAAGLQDDQKALRSNFAAIAYAYALDQICDFSDNSKKTAILSGYIEARWWLWRARTGVGKSIAKKMGEKAWNKTRGGENCSPEFSASFNQGIDGMAKFSTAALQLFGDPGKSLLNPKPEQARIFAEYQIALRGWVLAKKCNANSDELNLKSYYGKLIARRTQLLGVFRPDQLGGLEKNTNEMRVWGTHNDCNSKTLSFSVMGFDSLEQPHDRQAQSVADDKPKDERDDKPLGESPLELAQIQPTRTNFNFNFSPLTIECKENAC